MQGGGDLAMVNTEDLDILFAMQAKIVDDSGNSGAHKWWVGLTRTFWHWDGGKTDLHQIFQAGEGLGNQVICRLKIVTYY